MSVFGSQTGIDIKNVDFRWDHSRHLDVRFTPKATESLRRIKCRDGALNVGYRTAVKQ